MPDLLHELELQAPPEAVFPALATPRGLDAWWTLASEGEPRLGVAYRLDFGPGYRWTAVVSDVEAPTAFELQLVEADGDWTGTRVRFELEPLPGGGTRLRFAHTGWPEANRHWRVSGTCRAAYLRLLRRHVDYGETVPYADRLSV